MTAHEKLNKYYEKTSTCNIIATICDPRLKLQHFERNGWSNCDGENLIAAVELRGLRRGTGIRVPPNRDSEFVYEDE